MDNCGKKVSVIMGVYNQMDKEALRFAVDSIINQTLNDFEFLIYDDGSLPEAAEYICDICKSDSRIKLISASENRGLAFSLNSCIDIASGKYIARMDADDYSMPERLEKQYDFLETNPQYAWCGCAAVLFDAKGDWGERIMPEIPENKDFLRFSPYIHPSVMYRVEILKNTGKYKVSKETLRCEDYEIFMRLTQAGYRGYNLPEKLFKYREDEASYRRRKFSFRINEAKIRYRNFKNMKMLFPTGWIFCLRPIVGGLIPGCILSRIKRSRSKYETH